MIMSIKTIMKFPPVILLILVISILPLLAWNSELTDNSLKNLKVVEVDSQVGRVTIEFPDGHVSSLTVGDQVNQSDFKITAIYDFAIKLEGPLDDSEKKKLAVKYNLKKCC